MIRVMMSGKPTEENAKDAVRLFFRLLEKREVSDGGHEFSPTYISSCRVLDSEKIRQIFILLREWAEVETSPDVRYNKNA